MNTDERLDLEAIAKRDQELNSSSRMVSAFSQQAAPADRRSLLAEVRRLRGVVECLEAVVRVVECLEAVVRGRDQLLREEDAEVRRLRAQIEARDRALDDVSKFMEWRAARRAVETVSINSFVQPGGDL